MPITAKGLYAHNCSCTVKNMNLRTHICMLRNILVNALTCPHGIPDWSLNEKGDTPEKSRSREIPWYFWIFGSKSLQ